MRGGSVGVALLVQHERARPRVSLERRRRTEFSLKPRLPLSVELELEADNQPLSGFAQLLTVQAGELGHGSLV